LGANNTEKRAGKVSPAVTGEVPTRATETNGAQSTRPFARLEANGVVVKFRSVGVVRDTKPSLVAVDQVSVTTFSGHTISIVGQSGSGKSTLLKVLAGRTRPSAGAVLLNGEELTQGSRRKRRAAALNVQIVYQDPYASLNPAHRVGYQIGRAVRRRSRGLSRAKVRSETSRALERVGLLPAADFARKFPHELSGGQRQRAAIARAIAAQPLIVLADEPVSMLDVVIRAGILELLDSLRREGLGVIYVTHDIATARHFGDDVIVMHGGRIIERGPSEDVIKNPVHPYTTLLVEAAPDPARHKAVGNPESSGEESSAGVPIEQTTPGHAMGPGGRNCCLLWNACAYSQEICQSRRPPMVDLGHGHSASCWVKAPAPISAGDFAETSPDPSSTSE
jgi:peptide/nickel transport system ATP-binding protein